MANVRHITGTSLSYWNEYGNRLLAQQWILVWFRCRSSSSSSCRWRRVQRRFGRGDGDGAPAHAPRQRPGERSAARRHDDGDDKGDNNEDAVANFDTTDADDWQYRFVVVFVHCSILFVTAVFVFAYTSADKML